MRNRFDQYGDELWNCWCTTCMALTRAHTTGARNRASDALFESLEAGTHRHQGPRVSLVKFNARKYRDDGSDMREGLGIGMTPGGVTGSVRR